MISNSNVWIRFQVVVHLADVEGASEENLKSILESPIRDTKLPLGADVTVSRVTVADFNECNTEDYNDCSDQVMDGLQMVSRNFWQFLLKYVIYKF